VTEVAAPDSPQPSSKSAAPRTSLLELWAPIAALTAGFAYIIGFLVVNAHLERYTVLEFQPVRARYFSAALLFFVLTAVPALMQFGVLELNSEWVRKSRIKKRAWHQSVVAYSMLGILFFLSYVMIVVFLMTVMVKGSLALSFTSVAYWLLLLIGVAVARFIIKEVSSRLRSQHLRSYREVDSTDLFGLAFLVVLPAMQAAYFGTAIYPLVRPGFGGGGGWLVDAPLHSDSVPAHLRSLLSAPVAVVDRSDKFVRVVACGTRPGSSENFIAAEVSRDAISALYVREVIAISEFINRCPSSRPSNTSRPSQPRSPLSPPTMQKGTPRGPL
jgi:hypothetical protein